MCCPICLWLGDGGLASQLSHAFPNKRGPSPACGWGSTWLATALRWRRGSENRREALSLSLLQMDREVGGGEALAEGTAVASSCGQSRANTQKAARSQAYTLAAWVQALLHV